MTRVQIHFRLTRPLDDVLMGRIADVHAVYGIQRVQVAPGQDRLTVEYDATRMSPADVEATLAGAGIPAERG
jgi:hypothetical protein